MTNISPTVSVLCFSKMWRNLTKFPPRNLSSGGTVDGSELHHFKKFTQDWWNDKGELRALHALNKLRVPLIRDGILGVQQKNIDNPTPLKDISILDVGCGGGILTEPLARIGAKVTGLDPGAEIIEMAKLRSKNKDWTLDYVCSSVEDYACENKEKHDAVVASEILEHVTQKKEFVEACVRCLKPGGSIFFTTLNQTLVAHILGIVVAENLLHLLPKGTHQYEKFIKPHHLEKILEDLNCRTVLVQGIFYNFVCNDWVWCRNDSVNYALHAVKIK